MQITFKNVKATDAIASFKSKAKVPSNRWSELMGAANAHAFTVAGATKADLINDLYSSVLAAIENGESIGKFRKRFDEVVALHGWQYRGSRAWRTRVIYDNNLRSASMAGRWVQIQNTKSRRPFLVYITVDDERVRDDHRPWHHIVLPIDDEFWDIYYPPNGWGCRCIVRTASARDLIRQKLSVSTRPNIKRTRRINTRTGEDFGLVAEGIDVGWDYNPGKAWLGPDIALGQKLASLPQRLRQEAFESVNTPSRLAARQTSWQSWLSHRKADAEPTGQMFALGHVSPQLGELASKNGIIQSTSIVIDDKRLRTLMASGSTPKWLNQLPTLLRNSNTILVNNKNSRLVIVLTANAGKRKDRAVLEIELGKSFNTASFLGTRTIDTLLSRDNQRLQGQLR